MYKNTASQKVPVFAWDAAANAPKTGDAANITARISKDGAAVAQSNDVAPTELDATHAKGIYLFDLTQAETNCDLFVLSPVSSTDNVQIEPVREYTVLKVPSVTLEDDSITAAKYDESTAFPVKHADADGTELGRVNNIAEAVYGRVVRYVSATGDDAYDGLSWNKPKLTGASTITAASDGDMILIGPGSFAGQTDASGKNKLLIRGAGPGQTVLTHDTAETFLIGNDFDLQGLAINNTEVYAGSAAYCLRGTSKNNLRLADVTFDGNDIAVGLSAMTGEIRLEHCDLEAAEYAIIVDGTSAEACRFYASDTTFQVRDWTTCSAVALLLMDCAFEIDRCIAVSSIPTGGVNYAMALNILRSSGVIQGSWIRGEVDAGDQQNTWGVVADSNTDVAVLDSYVSVSGTTTSYDLKNSGGTLAVGNTHYDEDKTSGTITAVGGCTEARLAELDAANLSATTDWLKDERIGKREIVGTQEIFYKEDGTELMRFNLFDSAGNASASNVRKRVKV